MKLIGSLNQIAPNQLLLLGVQTLINIVVRAVIFCLVANDLKYNTND